jgi:hypothetical protein
MLYDKSVAKVCAHCLYAGDFNARHDLCRRYGPVPPGFHCAHFTYDPLRRKPPRPPVLRLPAAKDAFEL